MPMFSMVGAGSLQERRWADALSQVGAEVQVVQHRTELGVCPADGAKPETGMAPAFPDCSGCCRWGVGSSRAMLRHSPGLEQAAGRCEQGGGEDDNKLSAVRTAGGGAAAPQGAGCLPNPLAAPQLCESVRHTGCFSAINRAGGKEGTPHDTCARNARARARRRREASPWDATTTAQRAALNFASPAHLGGCGRRATTGSVRAGRGQGPARRRRCLREWAGEAQLGPGKRRTTRGLQPRHGRGPHLLHGRPAAPAAALLRTSVWPGVSWGRN